jgi:hypothetical protein
MKISLISLLSLFLVSCAGQKNIGASRVIASKNQEIAEVSGVYKVSEKQKALCNVGEITVKEEGTNILSLSGAGLLNGGHSVNGVNEGSKKESPDAFVWQETKAVLKDGVLKDYHKGCNGLTSLCLVVRRFSLETFIEFKDKKMIVHGGVYDFGSYTDNPRFSAFYYDGEGETKGKVLTCKYDLVE